MVGSTKDPADGKAVAGSVFAAVIVYAVCWKDFKQGFIQDFSPRLPDRVKLMCMRHDRSFLSSAACRHIYTYGRVSGALSR